MDCSRKFWLHTTRTDQMPRHKPNLHMDYKCLGKHFSGFDKKSFKKWGISNNLDGSEDDFFVNFYFHPQKLRRVLHRGGGYSSKYNKFNIFANYFYLALKLVVIHSFNIADFGYFSLPTKVYKPCFSGTCYFIFTTNYSAVMIREYVKHCVDRKLQIK